MVTRFSQGDILKVEGIRFNVLVISRDFFNSEGRAIVCPVIKKTEEGPLHIKVSPDNKTSMFVLCEQLRYLDLRTRGFLKTSSLSYYDLMNISDAVQSIIEY